MSFLIHAYFTVTWELKTDVIKLGQPMILECTVGTKETIDRKVTRQWSKGKEDYTISYNGHSNEPLKYEEILSTGRNFSLKINNVTEFDINILYQCRYEFSSCQKNLSIDKSNFERKYYKLLLIRENILISSGNKGTLSLLFYRYAHFFRQLAIEIRDLA